GLRSRIDSGTQIENSIIMGSDFFESLTEIENNIATGRPHVGIGPNTVISRAILDKNVRVGSDVRLVNRDNVESYDAPDGSFFIRQGIILVPKNGMIPSGTQV